MDRSGPLSNLFIFFLLINGALIRKLRGSIYKLGTNLTYLACRYGDYAPRSTEDCDWATTSMILFEVASLSSSRCLAAPWFGVFYSPLYSDSLLSLSLLLLASELDFELTTAYSYSYIFPSFLVSLGFFMSGVGMCLPPLSM